MNMEDFMIDFSSLSVEKKPFHLSELKLEHFYYCDEVECGMPISTSILLEKKYYDSDHFEWIKTISHQYISFDCYKNSITDLSSSSLSTNIVQKLEEIDLRDLKNYYFTDQVPEKLTRWELTYNKYFKIVGTYDQIVSEIRTIFSLLDFESILKDEVSKIQNKMNHELGGDEV